MSTCENAVPATSKKQLGAMEAAAHGHSTLGIPKSVGKDFVDATPKGAKLPERAAKDDSAINCADHVHNYLDAVVKGDAAGMKQHADKFHKG